MGSVEDWGGSAGDWKPPGRDRNRIEAFPQVTIVGSYVICGRMGTLPKEKLWD